MFFAVSFREWKGLFCAVFGAEEEQIGSPDFTFLARLGRLGNLEPLELLDILGDLEFIPPSH